MSEANGDNTAPDSNVSGDPADPQPATPPRRRLAAARLWLRAHTRHVLVVAVAAAVAGGVTPVITSGIWEKWFTEPQPGCPGAGCDGKNPQKEGCVADAVTWQPKGANPVALQVRYSKHCQAAWGRIVKGEKGDVVTLQVRGGSARSALVRFGSDQFTPMASVGASFHAKACAVPTSELARAGQWTKYCTAATDQTPWTE